MKTEPKSNAEILEQMNLSEQLRALGEEDYDEKNEAEWNAHVRLFCAVAEKFGLDSAAFEITSERFDPFLVELVVTRRGALSRAAAVRIVTEIKAYLLGREGGWIFRISLCDLRSQYSELVVWLETDKYRVSEFMGRISLDRCDSFDEFEEKFLLGSD